VDINSLIARDHLAPVVMGILNVTPDSFSDGGQFRSTASAVEYAERMVKEGAGIIDIGGESTRPGARVVSEDEELERVIPVIEAIRRRSGVPISVDTSKPAVMRQAIAAGAGMINDVRALRSPGALEAACQLDVPVCIMHMQGEPGSMQNSPEYSDVVGEVLDFLAQGAARCLAGGMSRERIIIDPGFGFGKRLEHNLDLMRHLPRFVALGFPVLVGVSRKSMIGAITGRPANERLYGSLGMAAYAALSGAAILRVHDVRATVDVLRVVSALGKVQFDA